MDKKRARFLPCLAAFTLFSSCVASFLWFVPAVPASAYNTVKLTVAQTRALFGDIITGTYYDTSAGDYMGCTFSYLTSTAVNGVDARESGVDAFEEAIGDTYSTSFLIYQSDILRPVSDQNYFTVRLTPTINIGMLNEFHVVAGFSSPAMQNNDNIWVSAVVEACDLRHNGFPYNNWTVLQNGNLVNGNSLDRWTTYSNTNDWLSWAIAGTSQTNRRFFVPNVINLVSDSYFSISDLDITRQGNCGATLSQSAKVLLYISTPILSSDYQDNNSGSGGGGSTGTDLTATNMKLDTIISILSMIANSQGSDSQTVDYLDSESPSDSSQLDNQNSQFNNEYSEAQHDQDKVDSVVNRDNLDSIQIDSMAYDMDAEFNDLWEDGNGGTNELILGMCLAPITIAVISYILFGKRM